MNKITINGITIETKGKSIAVNNGTVMVDGNVIQTGLSGIVKIEFTGDLASLETGGSAEVHGNVHSYVDAGGSIKMTR